MAFNFNTFVRTNRILLTIVGLLAGTVVTAIGILGAALGNNKTPAFLGLDTLIADIGNMAFWAMVVGPVLLAFFLWWLIDLISKRKEFNSIMALESKHKFMEKMEDAEEIAWRLHGNYHERLIEKKKAMRVRDR